ncbi:MAG: hypothetical protein WBA01_11970, partial [Phormidesmis sp.]
MYLVLFALFLGLVTYWVISRSIASNTSIPLWVLWLIMMTPILTFTLWMLITSEPPPTVLLYGLMILSSLILYAVLTTASLRAKQSAKGDSPNS